ncbi:ribosomal protein L16 [Cylindrobasidium torrendii FP15055 ss-10]|uniref:Ribosomal protein L16 n=1 Tax=Cylindrobasidium torrendii FP15055 ss-10 TaxID=1314674 RepID=A0A0D7B083_9AGAR|nr:ribosomal protein L16 [Cylindrobasidium torrendii FP15055 ss-10]
MFSLTANVFRRPTSTRGFASAALSSIGGSNGGVLSALSSRVGLPSGLGKAPTSILRTPASARFRGALAPRQVKYVKRHKGVIPIPVGGSVRGTTLKFGEFGIRIIENGQRLSAKQLTTAEDAIKRKLKAFKGARVFLRCFPDIPVCIKGNETRMGKGKGTFEYWATRLPVGRVIFEIAGAPGSPIRAELAKEILRIASSKLPCKMEFITPSTPPRLGRILVRDAPTPVTGVASIRPGTVPGQMTGHAEVPVEVTL